MNQISNERLLELGKAVTSSKICKIVHWGFRFVSNDELGAIIRRLRATEAERDAFIEQRADTTKQLHETRNSATDAVRKIEAERDAWKVHCEELVGIAEEMSKNIVSLWAERDQADAKVHELNRISQEMNETAQKLSARQAEEVGAAHAERDAYKAKLEQVRQWSVEFDGPNPHFLDTDDLNEILAEPQPGVTQSAPETKVSEQDGLHEKP